MMDELTFEADGGRILMPRQEYGMLLVSFDAPPPAPKIYRVALDGADGSLDMTEWAGTVNYEDRQVKAVLRDMTGKYATDLSNALTGRRWRLTNSVEPDYYYDGRVDSVVSKTRDRVTDISIIMTCKPYKFCRALTSREISIGTTAATLTLKAERMPAIPQVTLTKAATLTWNNTVHQLTAGTSTPDWLVMTDTANTLSVTASESGKLTLTWRDGVL